MKDPIESAKTARMAACDLLRARDIPEFSLGDRVDVRGWRVYANDPELVGTVQSLFIDVHTKAVRYLGVALTDLKSNLPTGSVLVPVGLAGRPGDRRIVVLRTLSSAQLALAPRASTRPVTRKDEDAVLAAYGMATPRDVRAADFYARPAFAEQRLFATRPPREKAG